MTLTAITRRAALVLLMGAALSGRPAAALDMKTAEGFVAEVVEELRALVQNGREGPAGAAEFLALLERRSAIDAVARFAAGRAWRDMDEAQQKAYLAAYRTYISNTYQNRFGEYAGEDIIVGGAIDAGNKGVIVKSTLVRPAGAPVAVEWLVSDRTGSPLLADIIFEGVSLAITLRETFGGMIETRGGDIDLFIADLAASTGA